MTYETQHVRTDSDDGSENGGCTEARMESIYKYLDGALGTEDLAEVKTHIQDCAECQSEHDLELIIRDVVKRSCEQKAPHSLKAKIMQRIEQLKVSDR